MTTPLASTFIDSVGVNIHLTSKASPYYTSWGSVLPMLQDIGIKHVRDGAVFYAGVDQNYYLYSRLSALVAAGIKISLVCSDPLNGYLYAPPLQIGSIFNWCGKGVVIFEGANEPTISRNTMIDPIISQDHQRSLYEQAHMAANVLVASPSYIQGNIADIAQPFNNLVDLVNIHPYPGMEHPETTGPGNLLGFMAASRAKMGTYHSVLSSENGYNTALQTTSSFLPVSEAIKTRYLPRMLLWAFINGVVRTYIYQLMDSSNNGQTDIESNFGLADFSGNPKSSYKSVKNLLALCNTPVVNPAVPVTFSLSGDQTNVQTVLLQRSDGSHVLFAWLGVSGWNASTRTALPPVTRQLSLNISPTPVTVTEHQFMDDGTLVTSNLIAAAGVFNLTVSDQLTALEF